MLHFATDHTGTHQTDPAAVSLARMAHDLLTNAALPPEPSLTLIETTAAAYAHTATAEKGTRPSHVGRSKTVEHEARPRPQGASTPATHP
ncbi:hypothetical protein RVR_7516 [Actinacidiphila reveromycinica]|uniref:Uncharacterized protein n=1 Tax=Actinacidiphila reveromycinica TaxID=659352 RepID=A0A7U3UX53_9ACTN|nr:hypothetical protein [Streptomyces sp. SN-593]BBB00449.1 hypothetical protein RVR_7516 [Streptomyces sp. SN-593]